MVSLVTLEQVKDNLNKLDDFQDYDLESKILQASAIVLSFLSLSSVPDEWVVDTSASPLTYDVPQDIQYAVITEACQMYLNRESSNSVVMSEATRNILKKTSYWTATIA